MDTEFTTDPKIEPLGEEFGGAGPLAIAVLLGKAKRQRANGKVEITYRELALRSFTERKEAQAIVKAAIRLGTIELIKDSDASVIASFPAWRAWNESFRRQQRHESDTNRVSACESVTTVQNKTVQDKEKKGQVEEVFAAWVSATERDPARTRLTSARRELIVRRLRDYPCEDLVAAAHGIGASAFHRGQNDRQKRFDSLELCLRDADHIEKFRDEGNGSVVPIRRPFSGPPGAA